MKRTNLDVRPIIGENIYLENPGNLGHQSYKAMKVP